MGLIDDVRAVCRRLASAGWKEVFRGHGLDLTAANLEAELARPLAIQRGAPGLGDFAPQATRAIEPGSLSASLLYHLLASPDSVIAAGASNAYPTVAELDTIENYVFAAAKRKLSDFALPVVAVFAYQYRAGFRTAHGLHADVVFSRTGIARVGSHAPFYDGERRSFWPVPAGSKGTFAVMPVRYAAFIAELDEPSSSFSILRPNERDGAHTFLIPRHKLFAGSECLDGLTIRSIDFQEWHQTEKLRRIHATRAIDLVPGFDADAPPLVRGSDELVTMEHAGASVLVVPIPRDSLVRVARQRNTVSGRNEVVRFVVPRKTRSNRFETSLQIPATEHGRAAPEYVNIRTRVGRGGKLENLNDLSAAKFDAALEGGRYEAAHYLDDTCDGAVSVAVSGLPAALPVHPAYSLVGAPDFLPRVDQIDVQRWAESNLRRISDHFNQGGPAPLCDGRNTGASKIDGRSRRGRTPNPAVRDPLAPASPAFDRNNAVNLTVTAIVGPAPRGPGDRVPARASRPSTFLPDAASDVFAPGWDVSQFGDNLGEFFQNYGLGSPFPEDAKLCAALNSFWPAAAPDAGRTFPELGAVTALPMLDDELGFHPDDPRVRRREVKSARGWDGEYGPYLAKDGTVNFASVARSDYVQNAVQQRLNPQLLAEIDTREILRRMEALRFCIRTIPPVHDTVANTDLWLVSARAVDDWGARADRASDQLAGSGYVFVFAIRVGNPRTTRDPRRLSWRVKQVTRCQLSDTTLAWRVDDGPVHETARPSFEGVVADFPAALAHRVQA